MRHRREDILLGHLVSHNMANFLKIGQSYFRKDESGQLYPVSDTETLKGLKRQQLPYEVVENNRPLSFGGTSQSGSTGGTSASSLAFSGGTPAPAPTGGTTATAPDDIGALIKARLVSAMQDYGGVTNTSELQMKREELLRKQLLSSPYAGGSKSEKNLTGAQQLNLMQNKGKEYEPMIQSLEEQIAAAKGGDAGSLDNLMKIAQVATAAGIDIGGNIKKNTQVVEVNGQQVLVDTDTGDTIRVLGASGSGGGGFGGFSLPETGHTVAEGDTFFNLANSMGTTVDEFRKANPGVNENDLKVGQKINIPGQTQNNLATGNPLVDNFVMGLNEYDGQKFITTSNLEGYSSDEKSFIVKAASALGIPTLSPKNADALSSIISTKENLADFDYYLNNNGKGGSAILPQSFTGQPRQYADVRLNEFLDLNQTRDGFQTWKASVIPLLSALKGAGSGGGGAKLFPIVDKMLPQETDTISDAQAKMKVINTIIDNASYGIIGKRGNQNKYNEKNQTANESANLDYNAYLNAIK